MQLSEIHGAWRVKHYTYVVRCVIWYHLYNFRNVKNTHGGVLLLAKLQVQACNFTKSNTPPWVFFMFFKLYKWHQIAQSIAYNKDNRYFITADDSAHFMQPVAKMVRQLILKWCLTFFQILNQLKKILVNYRKYFLCLKFL